MSLVILHFYTCVPSLASKRHQRVFVEFSRLVIGSFENGCASHRSLGSRHNGEVLASDTK